MKILTCALLLTVTFLCSCAITPPAERFSPNTLSADQGLLVVQFLHIGIKKDGTPFYDYMEGYYPRLKGDSSKNLGYALSENGIGIYAYKAGEYELERLREISRNEEYKTTIKYPVGLPVTLEAQKITNMGMILFLEDMDPKSNRYNIIPVDNETIVRDYLDENVSESIPESYSQQLKPQLDPIVTIPELRTYLRTLYSEEFLNMIPELN